MQAKDPAGIRVRRQDWLYRVTREILGAERTEKRDHRASLYLLMVGKCFEKWVVSSELQSLGRI